MARLERYEGMWYWNIVINGRLLSGSSTSFETALQALEQCKDAY